MTMHSTPRGLVPALLLVLAAGCASVPADRGAARVAALAAERGITLERDADVAALVAELAAAPLDAGRAVRIALVNNPQLAADYAGLGIAAAELYAAGRLPNPTLAGARLDAADGAHFSLSLTQRFTELLLMPRRVRAARAEFERAELAVADAVAARAASAEAAFWRYAGALALEHARAASADAAAAAAELAARYRAAGNVDELELAAERVAATQAELAHGDARVAALAARVELAAELGLESGGEWAVDPRLPPAIVVEPLDELVARAQAARLDLAAARRHADALLAARGVARGFRWLGDIEVGIESTKEPAHPRARGPAASIELPLWSRRTDAVLAADAELAAAVAAARALELAVTDGVRLAHARTVAAAARARAHGETLVPLAADAVARRQERVNFMLDGPFALVHAKRDEYTARAGWFAARAEYWAVRAQLARAVGGKLAGPADGHDGWLDPAVEFAVEAPADNHDHHGGTP